MSSENHTNSIENEFKKFMKENGFADIEEELSSKGMTIEEFLSLTELEMSRKWKLKLSLLKKLVHCQQELLKHKSTVIRNSTILRNNKSNYRVINSTKSTIIPDQFKTKLKSCLIVPNDLKDTGLYNKSKPESTYNNVSTEIDQKEPIEQTTVESVVYDTPRVLAETPVAKKKLSVKIKNNCAKRPLPELPKASEPISIKNNFQTQRGSSNSLKSTMSYPLYEKVPWIQSCNTATNRLYSQSAPIRESIYDFSPNSPLIQPAVIKPTVVISINKPTESNKLARFQRPLPPTPPEEPRTPPHSPSLRNFIATSFDSLVYDYVDAPLSKNTNKEAIYDISDETSTPPTPKKKNSQGKLSLNCFQTKKSNNSTSFLHEEQYLCMERQQIPTTSAAVPLEEYLVPVQVRNTASIEIRPRANRVRASIQTRNKLSVDNIYSKEPIAPKPTTEIKALRNLTVEEPEGEYIDIDRSLATRPLPPRRKSFEHDPFFHDTNRKGAERLLENQIPGSILFRRCKTDYLTISIKIETECIHMKIEKTAKGKLKLKNTMVTPEFDNTQELVDYFTKNVLTFRDKNGKPCGVYLKKEKLPLL